ncbi:MAG: S8 family serine peptidase, partial [Wenzhouxiangella sp.]|nr:S8 family serine peptidase [Wenzhouxiangella sp.]
AEDDAEDDADDDAEDEAEDDVGDDSEDDAEDRSEADYDADVLDDGMLDQIVDDVLDFTFDDRGEAIVRNELVILTTNDTLQELKGLSGWRELERQSLARFDSTLVRLMVPRYQNLEAALERVRALLPGASIDYNHSYELGQNAAAGEPRTTAGLLAGERYPSLRIGDERLGLIDGVIAGDHGVFEDARIRRRSFLAAGQRGEPGHGTAVASLLIGQSGAFQGMAPDLELIAAEAFFDSGEFGLVSTSYQLVRAMDWLAGQQVAVINMSLAGPANEVLERAVELALDENIVIVAAAGNDGPLAAPRFPAAYPGVIAVTAVDRNNRAYLRAGRGDHVDFAAPGVDIRVADPGEASGYRLSSGTSFATPFVAALVLHYRGRLPDATPAEIFEAMRADVIDLGAPGHDTVFGWGLAGASLLERDDNESPGQSR